MVFTSSKLLSDEAIAALGVPEHEIERYRRLRYQWAYSVPAWYEPLKAHTFESTFVSLSFDDITALRGVHQKGADLGTDSLKAIATRIDEAIEAAGGGTFFVKLGTRSAKDAYMYAVEDEELVGMVAEEMDALPTADRSADRFLGALFVGLNRRMAVESGADCLRQFAPSSRIFEDLGKITSFGRELYTDDIRLDVVLRRWDDRVPRAPWAEFRCFVRGGRMTAITQYFCDQVFDVLVDNEMEYRDLIVDFWAAECKEPLASSGFESYVIDFWVDLPSRTAIAIELNPFHNGAGGGLFKWSADRLTLLGEGPDNSHADDGPVFRIRKEARDDLMETVVPVCWARWFGNRYGEASPSSSGDGKCVIM